MRWIKFIKVPVFLACLVPLGLLTLKALHNELGANPIEVITHATGDWTIRFLLITLSITPLRRLTRQPWLIRFRRMTGLFAFFYGVLHFVTYIWLDKNFVVADIIPDIGKRPFITVGFFGFVLMIPLAVTSTQWMIRRMGKNWQKLHRLIYLAAIAGVIHYWWLVKIDETKPLRYAVILGVLLLARVILWFTARKQGPRSAQPHWSKATAEE